ncbi:MAG: DUF1778 domain-containing protein [Gemmatimonadota bacterium]
MRRGRIPVPSRARRSPIPVRLSDAERALIEAAAARRPDHLSSYMREAALDAARRDLGA